MLYICLLGKSLATVIAPCEQSLFYLFPSYTEKIGSAQI